MIAYGGSGWATGAHEQELLAMFPFGHDDAETKAPPPQKGKKDKKDKKAQKHAPPAVVPAAKPVVAPVAHPAQQESTADGALISILKDVCRALKQSQASASGSPAPGTAAGAGVTLKDANEKSVVDAASAILDKILDKPELHANRLVDHNVQQQPVIDLESYASGEVHMPDGSNGSFTAVWAKHENGVLSLTIAGETSNKSAGNGRPIGEFLVVVTGKSSIEKGVDIQSQNEVRFWLGKIDNLAIESDCLVPQSNIGEHPDRVIPRKPVAALQVVVTNKWRAHPSTAAANDRAPAPRPVTAESSPPAVSVSPPAATSHELPHPTTVATHERLSIPAVDGSDSSPEPQAQTAGPGPQASISLRNSSLPVDDASFHPSPLTMAPQSMESPQAAPQDAPPPGVSPAETSGNGTAIAAITEPPSETTVTRQPDASAILVMPARVVAGQFVTASVLGADGAPQKSIEISFNGTVTATNDDGRALYTVPENENPGPSLNVAMVAKADAALPAVEVLQPLAPISQQDAPEIGKAKLMTLVKHKVLFIDGHNFDGQAVGNYVTIDGIRDAWIVAASPVQIIAVLPDGVERGAHSVTIDTGAQKSNAAQFQIYGTTAQPVAQTARANPASRYKHRRVYPAKSH